MNLASLQRNLLALVKQKPLSDKDDPYLQRVAEGNEIRLVREIVAWWRAYGLSTYCPLTSALLVREERFEQALSEYIHSGQISPFIEEQGVRFLEQMSRDPAPLVAEVAQFELALIRVNQGDAKTYHIPWSYDPLPVLDALVHRSVLRQELRPCVLVVSSNLPMLFEIKTLA